MESTTQLWDKSTDINDVLGLMESNGGTWSRVSNTEIHGSIIYNSQDMQAA